MLKSDTLPMHRIILPETMQVVEFIPVSDLHIGSRMFDPQVIKDFVTWVLAKPNRYVGIGGDIGNYAIPGTKSDHWAEQLTPKQQIDVAVGLLDPIKERILYILDGNHDERLYRAVAISPAEQIAVRLKIENTYFEGVAYIALNWGTRKAKRTSNGNYSSNSGKTNRALLYIYAEHGTGAAGTAAGKLNRAMKPANSALANIYVVGHGHGQVFTSDVLMVPSIQGGSPLINRWPRMYSMCAPMIRKELYAYILATSQPPVGHTGKYILYADDNHYEYVASTCPFYD